MPTINKVRAIHPFEILSEEFLMPLGMSITGLARALDAPATRIRSIINGERGITPDTAVRLARHFGGDAASWMALQTAYFLKTLPNFEEIERKVQPQVAA